MKVWTYLEAKTKVLQDEDNVDETFVTEPELVGYFNEGLEEAEKEILLMPDAEYFRKKRFLNVVTGLNSFALPPDCFATKIRRLIYSNGSIIYPINRFKPKYEFEDLEFTQQFGPNDDYRHIITNEQPGQMRVMLVPNARETAIVPPTYPYPDSFVPAGLFTPVKIWYWRNVQRLPIPTSNGVTGELRFTESLVTSSINAATDQITVVCGLTRTDGFSPYIAGGIPYIAGDIVFLTPAAGSTLPAPLAQATAYYVIVVSSGIIKLATSLANALAGTAIDLTTVGVGYFDVQVVTTQAMVNALLLDIPEGITFILQWVKCRLRDKETDPRLGASAALLEQQRSQMVATLAEMVPDMENEIQGDFSIYQEMT